MPFKDRDVLIKDIQGFLQKNSALFRLQGTRISHFFEMNCYNYVVKFYQNNGFTISPKNLDRGAFKYKISAAGDPNNFSYFLVTKTIGKKKYEFEVHHNLALECAHENEIFYTADISVIKKDSIERKQPLTYSVKRSYCRAKDLQTFFEVKHLAPFPELLFSFTGIADNFLIMKDRIYRPKHLAPSLLISGRPNLHAEKIRTYLQRRYRVNIILNLFRTSSAVYSKKYSKETIGTLL